MTHRHHPRHRFSHRTLLAVILAMTACIRSASGGEHFKNLFGDIGARATAMAGTDIADAYDITSIFSNPAALAFTTHRNIFGDYRHAIADNLSSMTLAAPIFDGGRLLSIGLAYDRMNPVAQLRDSVQFATLERMDLASSVSLGYTFSVGVRLSMLMGSVNTTKAWTGFGSVGMYYEPTPSVTYAFVYNGISSDHWYSMNKNPIGGTPERLPRSFQIGVTMRYPGSYHSYVVAISATNEKVVGQSGQNYKAGIEVVPAPFLNLRAGVVITPSAAEGRYGFSFGSDRLQIGYALNPDRGRAPIHELTFSIEP